MAGSRVAELLRSFEVKVLAYDPFVAQEKARSLNVEMCPLEEVFLRSDVVTLHTPWLKETEGMITGRHFASMRSGATFINTARGAVVREQEMIQVLKERPDLFAVLDVTWPEPPESDSALYSLPNVILTPHIAGAMGPECRRLGRYMVEELQRYVAGRPLRWAITREQARLLA
jgi:phosphoglycerate dehydrogenase-like enzyme